MGRLFNPPETKGLWSATDRTLTVFVGEEVFIGYEGPEAAKGDARFSASERGSGEYAREVYREGAMRLTVKVDTPRPMTLGFEATDGNGRSIAAPIVIKVRTRPDHREVKAVGQMDSNACWAACLQWWLAAMPDRERLDQLGLIGRATGMAFRNGTLDPAQLDRLVARNKFGMATRRPKGDKALTEHFGRWPMLIGFKSPGGFSHINVIHGHDAKTGAIHVMEPWYPDPVLVANHLDTIDDGNGPPVYIWIDGWNGHAQNETYKFNGAHVTRTFAYYTTRPMAGNEFWVGFPEEYVAKF